jgi:hypothetical protein
MISISYVYQNLSIVQPDFWFGARGDFSLVDGGFYAIFSTLFLLTLLVFFFKQSQALDSSWRRRFFVNKVWGSLLFLSLIVLLGLFHYEKLPIVSARAMWLLFFFGLVYFVYFSFIEYSRGLPEKTTSYPSELPKKKYSRAFKKKR